MNKLKAKGTKRIIAILLVMVLFTSFALANGGIWSGTINANRVNLTIAFPDLADYTEVDAAEAEALAVNRDMYTQASLDALDAAVAAVVRDLLADEQGRVDGFAYAIRAAIRALVYKDADYSEVDAQITRSLGIDRALYTPETLEIMDAAVAAVVPGLNITEQGRVNEFADAIRDAIDELEYRDADYSAVDIQIEQAGAIDRTLYTPESLAIMDAAVADVVPGLDITEQKRVDDFAKAIAVAIAGLVRIEIEPRLADYTAVDTAIADALDVNRDMYTQASLDALDAAVAAVVRGLLVDEQERVDGFATAIRAAIGALVYRDADYSTVNLQIARSEGINRALYTPESLAIMDAAVAAVVPGLNITEQDRVNGFAYAIRDAIYELEYRGANYSAVDIQITQAGAIDRDLFTPESLADMDAAVADVVRGLDITEQKRVDDFAKAIAEAIAGLVPIDPDTADYTAVDAAIAVAVAVNRELYTPESLAIMDDAISAVVRGLPEEEQGRVDDFAEAIAEAVAGLVPIEIVPGLADYTAVNAAIADALAVNRDMYTQASLDALDAAVAAVVRGLPADQQATVDGFANAIRDAINNLELRRIYQYPATRRPRDAEEEVEVEEEDIIDVDTPLGVFTMFISDHVAYIIGYPDGTVRPQQGISRAEVATVFYRLLLDEIREANWTQENPFSDVNEGNWHNNAISVMANMGVLNGYPDGTFRPDATITRAELAAVVARFALEMGLEGANDVEFTDIGAHWAQDEILIASSLGWFIGQPDGSYAPDRAITRAEFMTIVNRVMERVPESVDDLLVDVMVTWIDNMDPDAWYYLAIQEATNSSAAGVKDATVPGMEFNFKYWVELLENPDWAALEQQWAERGSGLLEAEPEPEAEAEAETE